MKTRFAAWALPVKPWQGILVLLAGLLSLPAMAQVASVDPYHVTVTSDAAVLRSGDMDLAYAIARLEPGTVLRVDGQSGPWRRVGYPRGVGVVVRAADAEASNDGTSVTLTRPSSLRAHNVNDGAPGSWKPVLATALPAGSRLAVIRSLDHEEARHRAFLVTPPAAARAFVHESHVRRATAEEVAAAFPPETRPETGPTQPTTQPGATERRPSEAIDLTEKPIPTDRPAQAPQTTPAEPTVQQLVRETPPPAPPPVGPAPGSWEALEQAFQAVRLQPEVEAEWAELIAAYEKAMADLGDTESDRRLKAAMAQRVELIKIRQEVQQERRRLASLKEESQREAARLAEKYADLQASRRYNLVGRLTTSTVYDGVRLPRLLRIQSVGEPMARTLAYIRPTPTLELDGKVGEVVGVIGEIALDQSVNLTVVAPTRVDVLRPDQRP